MSFQSFKDKLKTELVLFMEAIDNDPDRKEQREASAERLTNAFANGVQEYLKGIKVKYKKHPAATMDEDATITGIKDGDEEPEEE